MVMGWVDSFKGVRAVTQISSIELLGEFPFYQKVSGGNFFADGCVVMF
jgi:hypothetical protein